MKRDERGNERHARGATDRNRLEKIGARVAFVEKRQHAVVQRFDRARHERAAAGREPRQQPPVLKQMLDLDGDVEADLGMRRVHGVDDVHGVGRTVEEVRIAKGDVVRARRDLRGDVGQDDLGLHHAELSLIHGHDRAMPAEMFAAPAGLGGTDRLPGAVGHVQRRVPGERRQARSIGHEKLKSREPVDGCRRGSCRPAVYAGLKTCATTIRPGVARSRRDRPRTRRRAPRPRRASATRARSAARRGRTRKSAPGD